MEKLLLKEVFAYYLPQYHEIPENNEWWGKGFTEWSHFKNIKKYHKKQEICYPGELGYYSLDDIKTIEKQYALASKYSISTFCFWHYWFGDDDLLLHKPAEDILNSDINVKFCFSWANHSWWNKSEGVLLKDQTYDYSIKKHFKYLLPFFKDDRYTKINNKPVFFIYKIQDCKNYDSIRSIFDEMARQSGFDGIFWVGENLTSSLSKKYKVDLFLNSSSFLNYRNFVGRQFDRLCWRINKYGFRFPRFYDYEKCVIGINKFVKSDSNEIPIVFPGWDSTIRHGKGGVCLLNNKPSSFSAHLQLCSDILKERPKSERYLVIKSWNEWAEGNFMEPSEQYGTQYLDCFRNVFEINKK